MIFDIFNPYFYIFTYLRMHFTKCTHIHIFFHLLPLIKFCFSIVTFSNDDEKLYIFFFV